MRTVPFDEPLGAAALLDTGNLFLPQHRLNRYNAMLKPDVLRRGAQRKSQQLSEKDNWHRHGGRTAVGFILEEFQVELT
jgi:hypothetical protein